jgi:dTMP kinase
LTAALITIEGIDGSGKTTQARLLGAWLKEQGHAVTLTREPGGTPLGERVRALVLHPGDADVSDRAELLLYLADRAQHVAEVVRPALAAGQLVISERYTDSTVAYQGAGRSFPREWIGELNRFATDGLIPDLTIVLDVPPATGDARRQRPPDRLEGEKAEFHQRVAEEFRRLAREEPARVQLVEATGDVDDVHRRVVELVRAYLEAHP